MKGIEPGGPRVGFDRKIEAVAVEFKVSKEALTGSGRREDWVAARRMLAYLARHWSTMTTGTQASDWGVIRRLCRDYEREPDRKLEKKLRSRLG